MALMSPEDLRFQESKVFSLLFFKENYGNSGSLWESCRRARPCMSHLFSRPLCRLVMEVWTYEGRLETSLLPFHASLNPQFNGTNSTSMLPIKELEFWSACVVSMWIDVIESFLGWGASPRFNWWMALVSKHASQYGWFLACMELGRMGIPCFYNSSHWW